jgi:hypothetical protein
MNYDGPEINMGAFQKLRVGPILKAVIVGVLLIPYFLRQLAPISSTNNNLLPPYKTLLNKRIAWVNTA